MTQRDDGHPVGAMLLLCSMFAFAFVFHALTQPAAELPARYDHQLAALALPAASASPSPAAPRMLAPAPPSTAIAAAAIELPIAAPASPPLLDGFTWPAIAPLPVTVTAAPPEEARRDNGAVTRALASTGSALRSAFRKTF